MLLAEVGVDQPGLFPVDPFPKVHEGATAPDFLAKKIILHDKPPGKIALTTPIIGDLVEDVGCVHSLSAFVINGGFGFRSMIRSFLSFKPPLTRGAVFCVFRPIVPRHGGRFKSIVSS